MKFKITIILLLMSVSSPVHAQDASNLDLMNAKLDQAVCVINHRTKEYSSFFKIMAGVPMATGVVAIYARWKSAKFAKFWLDDYRAMLKAKYSLALKPSANLTLLKTYEDVASIRQSTLFKDLITTYRPNGVKPAVPFEDELFSKLQTLQFDPTSDDVTKFQNTLGESRKTFDKSFGYNDRSEFTKLVKRVQAMEDWEEKSLLTEKEIDQLMKLEKKIDQTFSKLAKKSDPNSAFAVAQRLDINMSSEGALHKLESHFGSNGSYTEIQKVIGEHKEVREKIGSTNRLYKNSRDTWLKRSNRWIYLSAAILAIDIYLAMNNDTDLDDLINNDLSTDLARMNVVDLRAYLYDHPKELDAFLAAIDGTKYPMCTYYLPQ